MIKKSNKDKDESSSTTKYIINARFEVDGVVEKPDVVGAIFGQTEGLLGDDLDLKSIFLEYQQLNNDFYDWFCNKIYSLYEDDIKIVYEIDDKMRQIMNAKK